MVGEMSPWGSAAPDGAAGAASIEVAASAARKDLRDDDGDDGEEEEKGLKEGGEDFCAGKE